MFNHLKLRAAAIIASAGLSATVAQAQQYQVQVTSAFNEFSLQFTGGVADPYTAMWNVMEYQGQLALCGAGFLRNAQFSAAIRDMSRNATLTVDGQARPVNLTFFRSARSMNDLRSGSANCQAVGPLPSTNQSLVLRYGSATVRN